MRKVSIFLIVLIFAALQSSLAMGTLVEVSIETNKFSYSLSETPTFFVIAYNPNDYKVTLEYGSTYQADHIIDDIYKWSDGMVFAQVLTEVVIEPLSSHTWSQHRYSAQTLGAGAHTVVGWTKQFYSSPITFEVVPEPATILLLTLGGLVLRKSRR